LINRILGALIVLLFLPGVYFTVADLTPPHQEDFGAYYVAARALAGGESPFDVRTAARVAATAGVANHSSYIYPPLLALLLRPLAALPYSAAATIWFALSAAALFTALWLLRPITELPWRIYGWVCAAVLFLPPVHHTLQHGQITHFLLLLIVAGAAGGSGAAGWVGFAAALKVFPATLAVAYALSGRIVALVVMAGCAAVVTVAGALAAPAATADFVRRVAPQLAVEPRPAANNQSIGAVTARWFAGAPRAGRIVSLALTAMFVAGTLWALAAARTAQGEIVQCRRFSLVLVCTLIISPIVWDHYYVLLLLPIAVLFRSGDDQTMAFLLLTASLLLLSHRYWPLTSAMSSPWFMSEGLAGVVVLWIALLKALSYDRVCAVRRSPSAASLSRT
jgi:alpha-1,2-mannosyltransferase